MTRKRKNIESAEDGYSVNNAPQGTFPKKTREGNGPRGFKNETGYALNTEDTDSYYREESEQQIATEKAEYPTELVSYLRHFSAMIEDEGVLDDDAYQKCMEECSGSEERLLSFFDACKVVETIFCSCAYSALLFLKSLFKLKHKKLLDLFFATTAARTIEKLVTACAPISKGEQIEVLSKMTDLLCDNWNDASTTQSSSFLIRCLARVFCGISQPSDKMSDIKHVKDAAFAPTVIGNELKQLFSKISDLAVDSTVNPASLRNLHCSLVVHDILDCDAAVGAGKCSQFVQKQLSSEENVLIQSLTGKCSSRVWDRALSGCSEDMRFKLWESVVKNKVEELAMDSTGNHPLKNFIATVNSSDLAKKVSEAVTPLIGKLFTNNRPEVVAALVKCVKNDEELQEGVIKELRAHFCANKPSNKDRFFLNVLTMNKYDGHSFNPNQVDTQGSYLVQALLQLQKVKTLSAGVLSLDANTICMMALNKPCAFVLQAVLNSTNVDDTVKNHVISSFNNRWEELAAHPIGSRTFDCIWDNPLFTVNRKQELMKSFVNVRNTSRNWKFVMLRCDMNLFRKDRKSWVKKMKNWPKE